MLQTLQEPSGTLQEVLLHGFKLRRGTSGKQGRDQLLTVVKHCGHTDIPRIP